MEDLAERLRELGGELGIPGLEQLAGHAELCTATADSPLQPGECVVVLAGHLELVRADDGRCIAAFGRGAMLGGSGAADREVTLRSAGAEVARIAAAGFDHLLAVDPVCLAKLTEWIAGGERSLQVAIHLSHLFPRLDRAGLEEFAASVEWVPLRGGDLLFSEGDRADAAYLVISGRLHAVAGRGGAERVLNEVVAGETVGEMALLDEAPRSASVYAVRDSQLVRIPRAVFDALTERHPDALRRIAGFVVERLRRGSASAPHRAPTLSMAVVPARPDADLEWFMERLQAELGHLGAVARIDRSAVDRALGRPGIADARDDESAGMRLVRWLGNQDAASRYAIFQAEAELTPWTERALRQADHVLVVTRAASGPSLGPIEARLAEIWRKTRPPRRSLVLIHAAGSTPARTADWLIQRDVEQHFHVRDGNGEDVARLARLLTGRGVGLVLGGGGARGFAHLGVLRALEEIGAPVDAIGGTSIGSIIAALPAMGLDAAATEAICRQSFSALFDPTFPVVALLTGRRIGKRLAAAYADIDIEDLILPFFCVSTNLTQAQAMVHRRGSLFRAVRSSIALPGVLPPVALGGDLHVDGGLVDNLPIEPMAELWGGSVVAIDVSPEEDLRAELDLAPGFSGWSFLWKRLNPFAEAPAVPRISSVLMRSVVVSSLAKARESRARETASLYLKLPVDDWDLLQFDELEAIAARGYEASAGPLRDWWKRRADG